MVVCHPSDNVIYCTNDLKYNLLLYILSYYIFHVISYHIISYILSSYSNWLYIYRINKSCISTRKDFNYLLHPIVSRNSCVQHQFVNSIKNKNEYKFLYRNRTVAGTFRGSPGDYREPYWRYSRFPTEKLQEFAWVRIDSVISCNWGIVWWVAFMGTHLEC